MKKTIAVVVTVRNQEYEILPFYECLLRQKRAPEEIWFADAESTDESREILKKLEASDPRVHVVRTEHANLSCARNRVLERVDADLLVFPRLSDRLAPGYLRDLAHVMESDSDFDMVASGYAEITSAGKVIHVCKEYSGVISWKKMLGHCFTHQGMKTGLWNKMFRRDRIEQYALRFPEELTDGGDVLFLVLYSLHVRKVQILPKALYGHEYDPLAIRERIREEKRFIKEKALQTQKHPGEIRKIRRNLRIQKACGDWNALSRVCEVLKEADVLREIPSFYSYQARKARRLLWATQRNKKDYSEERSNALICLRTKALAVFRDRNLSGMHRLSVIASGFSPSLGIGLTKLRKCFRKR